MKQPPSRPSGPLCFHCGLPPFVVPPMYREDVDVVIEHTEEDQATVLAILAQTQHDIDEAEKNRRIAVRVLRSLKVPWSVIVRQCGVSKSSLIREQRDHEAARRQEVEA